MTLYPHRIRLRGPWECIPLHTAIDGASVPAPVRMTLPCRWAEGGLTDFAGRVRFVRRFGYPGQIDPTERVWLTFGGIEGIAEITLNGQRLGQREANRPFEYEVTSLLRERNELRVEVEGPTTGGLWGEVAMEVRRTAFLRDLRGVFLPESHCLRVSGEVCGEPAPNLELYVLVNQATVAYTTTTSRPEGQPFDLHSDPLPALPAGPQNFQVDLVQGAVVWYTSEQPFTMAD